MRRLEDKGAPFIRHHHKTGSNIHRDSHEKVRSTSGHHGEHQQERPDHQKRPQRPTGRRLSIQSPSDQKQYKCDPLQQFLLSIPLRFPPINDEVEPHEYFDKWQAFDEEAFEVDGGEDLKILLGRGKMIIPPMRNFHIECITFSRLITICTVNLT